MRINDELRRELETRGFVTEMREYPSLITFGDWLRMRRQ
jgi:hypothetical protein